MMRWFLKTEAPRKPAAKSGDTVVADDGAVGDVISQNGPDGDITVRWKTSRPSGIMEARYLASHFTPEVAEVGVGNVDNLRAELEGAYGPTSPTELGPSPDFSAPLLDKTFAAAFHHLGPVSTGELLHIQDDADAAEKAKLRDPEVAL